MGVSYAVKGRPLPENERRAWIMTTASDELAAPQIFIGSPPIQRFQRTLTKA